MSLLLMLGDLLQASIPSDFNLSYCTNWFLSNFANIYILPKHGSQILYRCTQSVVLNILALGCIWQNDNLPGSTGRDVIKREMVGSDIFKP